MASSHLARLHNVVPPFRTVGGTCCCSPIGEAGESKRPHPPWVTFDDLADSRSSCLHLAILEWQRQLIAREGPEPVRKSLESLSMDPR